MGCILLWIKIMNNRFLLLVGCILLFLPTGLKAQAFIEGSVRDTAGKAIPYCTVSAMSLPDSTVLCGTVSDTSGFYRLPLPERKKCYILFSHMAYVHRAETAPAQAQTRIDMILTPDIRHIDAVVVTAKFIEYTAGKYTVGLQGNPIAHNRSAQQVLGLLPGVTTFGGLEINGRSVAVVYIDNRQVDDMKELEAIRAEDIERVEIENNSGSAHDATQQGGIIRIWMKKQSAGSFYGNAVVLGGFSKEENNTGFRIPFSARLGKLNLYNYLRASYMDIASETDRTDYFTASSSGKAAKTHQQQYQKYVGETISLIYEFNPRHSLGANGNFIWQSAATTVSSLSRSLSDPEPATDTEFTRFGSSGNDLSRIWQACLQYDYQIDTLGSALQIKAEYMNQHLDKRQLYTTAAYDYPPEGFLTETEQENELFATRGGYFQAKADWNKTFSRTRRMDAGTSGYLYDLSNRNELYVLSDGNWLFQNESSFRFPYKASGTGTYVQYSEQYGRFTYRIGLRYQWDRMQYKDNAAAGWKKRDYHRLFPNLTAAYVFADSRLNLDIFRYSGPVPTSQLVPRAIRQNNYTYTIGNPSLKPYDGMLANLTYILKDKWDFSYFYHGQRNLISDLYYLDPNDENIVYRMPTNLGRLREHLLRAAYNAPVTSWLRVFGSINGTVQRYAFGNVRKDASYLDIYFNLEFQILPSLRTEIRGSYSTPHETLDTRTNRHCAVHCFVSKTFFSDKFEIIFIINNLLETERITTLTVPDGSFTGTVRPRRPGPTFAFSLGYRFNHRAQQAVKRVELLENAEQKMN